MTIDVFTGKDEFLNLVWKGDREPGNYPSGFNFSKDRETLLDLRRMRCILRQHYLTAKYSDINEAWEEYSDVEYSAGWLDLPKSDSEILDVLLRYLSEDKPEPEPVELTPDLVLKCTLSIWAVRRVNEYREVLDQPKLDMSKPFLIPLSDDVKGLIIKDLEQKFLFADGNHQGCIELPVDDDIFTSLKAGDKQVPSSERKLYFREECHVLYRLLEQAYFDMLYDKRITLDTYASVRVHWLTSLKLDR